MKKNNCSIQNTKHIILVVLFLFFVSILTVSAQEEVINQNCELNQEIFDRDWQKYSDIDENLSFDELALSSRSWETQQYYQTRQKIVDLKLQVYFLKRDMEIDALMRRDLRDYKDRLVRNIKVNLLKSFWRLAYVTYDTIKSAKGLGESYAKALTSAEVIPKIGSSLKVIQGLKPKQPISEKNQMDTTTKVKSVAVKGALEAIESLADPAATGKAVYEETVKQVLPSADLTQEEIALLKKQHLDNNLLTAILEESYRINRERRKRVEQLEEEVKKLEEEHLRWQAEEKKRVSDLLVDNCRKNLQKVAQKPEPAEEEVVQYGEAECPLAPDGFTILSPLEDGGFYISKEFVLSFCGIEPETACAYELRDIAPDFPWFVTDSIGAHSLIWSFSSISEAGEEFSSMIEKGKSEMLGGGRILDDTENRFVIENTERFEETASDGTVDGERFTYNRSFYATIEVVLEKNYIFVVMIGTDTPVSVEAKAIAISKDALIELEKNTKLLLENRK